MKKRLLRWLKILRSSQVYFTATMDAAIWGAELAVGNQPGRIYQVEPTGTFENDPNLTDKKFPGNPTRSYRTKSPLRVVGEVLDWEGHAPEVLQNMLDNLEKLKRQGIEAINDWSHDSRLYCAQIVGWLNASFDNIDDERRLFDGFFK